MPNPLDIKRPLLQEPTLNSPLQTYFAKLDVTLDAAQHKASLALEHLLHLHQSTDSGNRKRRWWKRPQHTGAYLWGEPGRGKTMLLDAMFACLLGEAGTREGTGKRVHYHQFLRELHQKMSQNRGKDYLLTIADELASSCSVFCLDEFHVHDVADVVLLQRFIEALLKRHVLVVLTSNYPPEDLLPDPNKHERALPLIAMLKKHLQVIELDGDRDYRQRNEAPLPHYLSPVDDSTDAQLLDLLDQYGAPVQEWREGVRLLPAGDLTQKGKPSQTLKLSGQANSREIAVRALGENSVWFDFEAICLGPCSHLDYLALAECYSLVVVTDLQAWHLRHPDGLRRFIWLVDVLYEHRHRLLLSSEKPIEELLGNRELQADTLRTLSRLIEMRSPSFVERRFA